MKKVNHCPSCKNDILFGREKYEEDDTYNVWVDRYGLKFYLPVCKKCFNIHKKEYKMKDEIAEVKIKDLKKAYNEGCEDVKATLKKMYPDVFKERNITEDLVWKMKKSYSHEGMMDLCGWYDDCLVVFMNMKNGIRLYDDVDYTLETVGELFKVIKR